MVETFLTYLRYELYRSERTVHVYGSDLRSFEAYFKSQDASLRWDTVDGDVIRNWMEVMMDKGNKASSVDRRLSSLHTFYRWALAHGIVSSDPSHGIQGPKKERVLPQFLKESQMDALLDSMETATEYKDILTRTVVMTFYETGIRLSELLGLRDADVSFVNNELKVTGKRNKQRIIPFGGELREALTGYMARRDHDIERKSDALFLTEKGLALTTSQVETMVRRSLSKVCTLKKRSPHVLRHTFATAMLNHEAGLESVKKLLGHAKLSTTEIYTHTTFEQLKRVYKEAHPRA